MSRLDKYRRWPLRMRPAAPGSLAALGPRRVPHCHLPQPSAGARKNGGQSRTPPRNNQFGYGIINAEPAGDFTWLAATAPATSNSDGVVDDADFSIFLGFYNAYPPRRQGYISADFTGDGVADDQDFQEVRQPTTTRSAPRSAFQTLENSV